MKKVIQFHKAFLPTAIGSLVVIAFGLVGLFTRGINLGVDFQAGVNQYVQLAYPAAQVSYSGTGTCVLSITDDRATLVFSGADVEARTAAFELKTVGTLNDLAAAMAPEGVTLAVTDGAGLSADLLLPTYQGDYSLSAAPVLVRRAPGKDAEQFGSIEEIRKAVASVGSASVQSIGGESSMQYLVRVRDDGTDKEFSQKVPALITSSIEAVVGQGKVVAMRTEYVGAKFSASLASGSVTLVLLTLFAIFAYAAIRFRIEYALGSIIAIVHDALIMIAFIVWTRMEFNTTSIAAILTILGYSINDTIVIFDRIREERKINPDEDIVHILDRAQSEMLGRTFITTITTMVAVLALYFFTSGSIKDFALALIVGMVSGVYSTIYIASAFVAFWDKTIGKRPRHSKAVAPVAKPAN